jgi:hypothetical protein
VLANEIERLKLPQHVAFRTMGRWVVIPVIARIESREGRRLYGHWFSRFTPEAPSEKCLSTMSSIWETTMTLRRSLI